MARQIRVTKEATTPEVALVTTEAAEAAQAAQAATGAATPAE
jgi:hypothetical protein